MVEHFNIRQLLETLKIPNWKNIRPFQYYLDPLQAQLNKVRKLMLDMGDKGHLFIKYEIEKNKELLDETVLLLQKD
jgi:hypothetical protein